MWRNSNNFFLFRGLTFWKKKKLLLVCIVKKDSIDFWVPHNANIHKRMLSCVVGEQFDRKLARSLQKVGHLRFWEQECIWGLLHNQTFSLYPPSPLTLSSFSLSIIIAKAAWIKIKSYFLFHKKNLWQKVICFAKD